MREEQEEETLHRLGDLQNGLLVSFRGGIGVLWRLRPTRARTEVNFSRRPFPFFTFTRYSFAAMRTSVPIITFQLYASAGSTTTTLIRV